MEGSESGNRRTDEVVDHGNQISIYGQYAALEREIAYGLCM